MTKAKQFAQIQKRHVPKPPNRRRIFSKTVAFAFANCLNYPNLARLLPKIAATPKGFSFFDLILRKNGQFRYNSFEKKNP